MRGKTLCLFLLTALAPAISAAHNIDSDDNAARARDGRLFRFDYANDFFGGTDRYYTQGYGFDLFHPALAKSPLMLLLAALPGASKFYGLTFRHNGFTPSRLDSDAALPGDRPYSCYMFLGHSLISKDSGRNLTLVSEMDAGFIGESAGGRQIQTGLHRSLGNALPRGWDNQIRNDIVLDYYVRVEKQIASKAWGEASVLADATLGTLYTNAAAGLTGRVGKISEERKRFYLFGRVEEKVVGYDATLQGGVFERKSPYTLNSDQIERAVFLGDIGLAFEREGYAVVFTRSFQDREFQDGLFQQWGEISLIKYF